MATPNSRFQISLLKMRFMKLSLFEKRFESQKENLEILNVFKEAINKRQEKLKMEASQSLVVLEYFWKEKLRASNYQQMLSKTASEEQDI